MRVQKWLISKNSVNFLLKSKYVTILGSRLSSSDASKNVITAIYVDSEGNPSSEDPFDKQSKLSDQVKGSVKSFLKEKRVQMKPGFSKILCWPSDVMPYKSISLAAVSKDNLNDPLVDLKREQIRLAYSSSIRTLSTMKETEVAVDSVGGQQQGEMGAVSEGCHLAAYNFDMYKAAKYKKPVMNLELLDESCAGRGDWMEGFVLADCQNMARTLTEMPSNLLTPEKFVEEVVNLFEQQKGDSDVELEIKIREEAWLREQQMNALLAVAQGSSQKPYLLELHLTHPKADKGVQPLVLVGKGVTFDSGGISIKPSKLMDVMRGDMGGAACVAATALGALRLNVCGRVVCLMGLVENMPSGDSFKPGDVIFSRSGHSIQVDNTDAEGRLVLADLLDYSEVWQPSAVVDVATLTLAVEVALGAAFTGVFTTTNKLFDLLRKSGSSTGDQVWRLPLSPLFTRQVSNSPLADLNNSPGLRGGGACTAAAFLSHFVKCPSWAHLDIGGVFENKNEVQYLSKGMSGRPTRTLIQFCRNYFSP